MADDKPLAEFSRDTEAATGPTAQARKALQPLRPWQYAFAEWLAHQVDRRPKVAEQIEKAEELAQHTVTASALRRLKDRRAFRDYFGKLHAGALQRARAKLEARYEKFIDAHVDGLEMAYNEGDYHAIPKYTVPVIDRIAPKRDAAPVQQAVVVHVTTEQAAKIEADEAEFEILPPERIDNEEEGY
jgi:hypothetical protein